LGLVDEVVVQICRNNPERLAWGLTQPKQTAELRKELALAKQQGLNGVDLFFHESARHHVAKQAGTVPTQSSPNSNSNSNSNSNILAP
jgi:hypothetical protein